MIRKPLTPKMSISAEIDEVATVNFLTLPAAAEAEKSELKLTSAKDAVAAVAVTAEAENWLVE